MKSWSGAALAAPLCAFLALASSARASTLFFPLDVDKCTGTCGTPNFGTVELDQIDSQTVLVSLSLNPGEGIVQTGSSNALMFDITGDPAINITNLTPGFIILSSGLSAAGLGSFEYGVDCGTACGPGASKTYTGILSFDVMLQNSGNLFTTDFTHNTSGIYFATDIIGTNGKTGPVGSDGPTQGCLGDCGGGAPPAVPEPASFVLVGTALIGTFFVRRRKRT